MSNLQKSKQFSRSFFYLNTHQIPYVIKKFTLFYSLKKDISSNSLIKISSFLELISFQRPFFIRAKNSSLFLKIRKGAPMGLKITLRNGRLSNFLRCLIWQIFPNIKNFNLNTKFIKLKKKKINSVFFAVIDPFAFSILTNFYFFFKSCTNLKILVSFPNISTKNETFFHTRYLKLPI
jgi:hypothetical protein